MHFFSDSGKRKKKKTVFIHSMKNRINWPRWEASRSVPKSIFCDNVRFRCHSLSAAAGRGWSSGIIPKIPLDCRLMNENWITNKLKGSYKIVFQQIDEMIKLPRIERQDDEKKSSMQTERTRNNSRNVYRLTVNVISFAFLPFLSVRARFLTILSNSVVRNSHRQTDKKVYFISRRRKSFLLLLFIVREET